MIFFIEFIVEFRIKSFIKKILQNFFSKAGPASLVAQNITQTGAVARYFLTIKITRITAGSQNGYNPFVFSAKCPRSAREVMIHVHLRFRKNSYKGPPDHCPVFSSRATSTIKIYLGRRLFF